MTSEPTTATPSPVLDIGRLERDIDQLQSRYRSARPYPHIILDQFLEPKAAEAAIAEFPPSTPTSGPTTSTSMSASSPTPIRRPGVPPSVRSWTSSTRPGSWSSSAPSSEWTT